MIRTALINTEAMRSNTLDAMQGGCPLLCQDLARVVTNSGEREAGAAWLTKFVAEFLQSQGQEYDGWAAFDFAIFDLENIEKLWPCFQLSCELQPIQDELTLPRIAEFLVRRLPSVWLGRSYYPREPVTQCVALADNIDSLTGLFTAGVTVTGSKDPYALRRHATRILRRICAPTLGDFA